MPKTKPAYPEAFKQQIVELAMAGRSPAELAREFEVSAQSVTAWVARAAADAGKPVRGKEKDQEVVIRNSEYWIGPDVIVSQAEKSRFRGFGRNWNLAGRSAEIVKLDWGNQ